MYPGGKNQHYQKIINRIPPHETYIETHLGSGAVMRHKRPARLNVGIELNPDVLAKTAVSIVGNGDTEASSDAAMGAAIVGNGETEASLNLAMLAIIAKNGDADGYKFFRMDAAQWLRLFPFTGNEFIYADPPSLMHPRRCQRPLYDFEYTDKQHEELLETLLTLPCPVMVSGYWSELYADRLAGWHTFQFQAMTRGGSMATEWLWMNYPPPTALHDYSYLGRNFRERERIKRKKTRWVERLKRTEGLERQAILWAIQESGLLKL